MITWYATESPTEPGFWACARRGPGVNTVEADGFMEKSHADAYARQLNREHQRKLARIAQADRPGRIPAGFYTDKDAA